MRIAGVWFHRNDFVFSADAEIISTLKTTIFNCVGHNDTDIYANPEAVYSVTYGDGPDAVKVAAVPIALERESYAVFACVGASDGFSPATLVSIARRMGNAIRLLVRKEDLNVGSFRNNRTEIRAVLNFTRRSLAEPDLVHGAFTEAYVDAVFDTSKPKFISQIMQQRGQQQGGGGNNNNASSSANDGGGGVEEHSLQYWSEDPNEQNPIYEVHWIRGAVLCGNHIVNSFEDEAVARSCQTTARGWDGFLYLARVMLAFQCDRRTMESATYLETAVLDGEDRFRHLRLFRDDVPHTVEGGHEDDDDDDEEDEDEDDGKAASASASSPSSPDRAASPGAVPPLEKRAGVKVSERNAPHLCDVTAVTGDLLRSLDEFGKAALEDVAKDKNNADCNNNHPELNAMLQALGLRFEDSPQSYENYANAVHSTNVVDSLRGWGEMETSAFQEQRDKKPVRDAREPLHYQVKSPDNQVQFWVSFKYVDFDLNKASNNGDADDDQQQQQQRESSPLTDTGDVATSSTGYVIALFSYCLQFCDPAQERPPNCKTTNNGFKPLLDGVMELMVETATNEVSIDSDIWTSIRSSRVASQYFVSKSPHLLAIDVVDRSTLLDVPNARILADDISIDPDIICSRLAPRLVRRSPILESLDVDESRGETCEARRQALLQWLDTFRRSISRAHQMFSSGSVEGAWNTEEGSFFHGLFLTRKNTGAGAAHAPYAVVAAPAKYLSRLPYGTLVPTAASTPFSSTTATTNPAAADGAGGGGGGRFNTSSVEDVPVARIYTDNAPPLEYLPRQPIDNLPLGLLEVHCMFTPNTDLDIMAAEMFYALSMMRAF